MSDVIWETFDGLFKTVHRQGRRVEELEARLANVEQLEARVVELERRLAGGESPAAETVTTLPPPALLGAGAETGTGAGQAA